MKARIGPNTIEVLRDALDFAVEQTPEGAAIAGIDWTGGAIEINGCGLIIRLSSHNSQQLARFDVQRYHWEILHACNECGREDWSEHREWSCNCRAEPTRNDPEGWRE